jgi:hypothetical protein
MNVLLLNQENFSNLVQATACIGMLLLFVLIPLVFCYFKLLKDHNDLRMELVLNNSIEPKTPYEKLEWDHMINMDQWQRGNQDVSNNDHR